MSAVARTVSQPLRRGPRNVVDQNSLTPAPPHQRVRQHFDRVLAAWPQDPLRPKCQLQDVLRKRVETADARADTRADLAQVNALMSLVENRYQKKYHLAGGPAGLQSPASNPEYYRALLRELDEAPTRSWVQRVKNKLTGMFRVK